MPITSTKIDAKDASLVEQVNLIMDGVTVENVAQIANTGKSELTREYIEEFLMADLPTDGRLLVEEYPKLIHLNNSDPERFSIKYWENFLKVDPVTLRNIFNYVYVPIVKENQDQANEVISFKDFEFGQRRKLIEAMSVES